MNAEILRYEQNPLTTSVADVSHDKNARAVTMRR